MSSSKLQRLTSEKLSIFFGGYTIRENMRPKWMPTDNGGRLELDFFIEELKCAVEVQGIQHYEYSEFFHGDYGSFLDQQKRDQLKRDRCAARGIKLYEIFDEQGLYEAIERIQDANGLVKRQDELLKYIVSEVKSISKQEQKIRSAKTGRSATKRERKASKIASMIIRLDGIKKQRRRAIHANRIKEKIDEYLKDFEMSDFNCVGIYESFAIKKFIEQYEYQDPDQYMPAITDRTPTAYNRAKYKLSIRKLSNNKFEVSGGEDRHVVLVDHYGNIQCDCRAHCERDTVCSHIWKYHQEYGDGSLNIPRTLRMI